jgi:hypothetical protein
MLNQEYGKQVAKSGSLGIANSVMGAMIKLQEKRSSAKAQPGDTASDETDASKDQTSDSTLPAAVAASAARGKSVVA